MPSFEPGEKFGEPIQFSKPPTRSESLLISMMRTMVERSDLFIDANYDEKLDAITVDIWLFDLAVCSKRFGLDMLKHKRSTRRG